MLICRIVRFLHDLFEEEEMFIECAEYAYRSYVTKLSHGCYLNCAGGSVEFEG